MVGIVLATHGTMGQSLIEAVELIAGHHEQVQAIGLSHGDGVEDFQLKLIQALKETDKGEGVLVLVDFIGGTPANTVIRLMREQNLPCIAGVNLPMLVEALTNREGVDLKDLQTSCINVAKESIVNLVDFLKQFEQVHLQEEDF